MITQLDFELSSLCNAGCPVCSRRQYGQYVPFEQTYWKLDEVKRVVGEELVKQLTLFNICGNFGDGMGNPDIVRIIQWIKSVNPKCKVHISTNGGIGSSDDYRELAKLKTKITFGVDGYGDKNELYRINAKWDKVYENIKAYSDSYFYIHKKFPKNLRLQFLLWDQTKDQILPILDFCKKVNISKFYPIKPYTHGKYTRGYDMKGKYIHSLTFTESNLVDFLSQKVWKAKEYSLLEKKLLDYDLTSTPLVKEINPPVFDAPRKKYEPREVDFTMEQKQKIDSISKQGCYSYNTYNPFDLSSQNYNLYITYNGHLMPCCMIPPEYSISLNHSQGVESPFQVEILNEVVGLGIDNFSLKDKTITEIFESGILHKLVYNKFKKQKQFAFCKITCGKC